MSGAMLYEVLDGMLAGALDGMFDVGQMDREAPGV
jgi:hypothetical protein